MAALAAGLALYLVVGSPGDVVEGPQSLPEIAHEEPGISAPVVDEPSAVAEHEAVAELEGVADEELAIALEYETLRDFEVIDQLELLEALAAYEERESRG